MSSPNPQAPRRKMTVDEYLAFERDSPVRHEYLAGEVFAMSGSSARHDAILDRLLNAISHHLRGSPWHVRTVDVRVRIRTYMREYFYYPDLLVLSDIDRSTGAAFVRSPKMIAEVISASTENIDRREKALMYREVTALEEYILVAPEPCEVTVYRRRQEWRPVVCNSLEETAELQSIGLSLPLTEIYPTGLS